MVFVESRINVDTMATGDRIRLLLPLRLRNLPTDLWLVLSYLLVTDLVFFLPVIRETPLRVVVGLPFVFFIPGYTFVAALFPQAIADITEELDQVDQSGSTVIQKDSAGIDGIERVALSFGLSLGVVPLIGLVLNFTPWGIRITPILVSLTLFVLATSYVAAHRRWKLPEDQQFRVPIRPWFSDARTEILESGTRAEVALNILLVFSVLLAAGSMTYAVALPKQDEPFTEFYLLAENGGEEPVPDNYTTDFTIGESKPLVVGIGNYEHEKTSYTVVSKLQRVRTQDNTTQVLEEEELARFETTLNANETSHHTQSVTPTLTGGRLRLVYLLYRGQPPSQPTTENAYRETNLWINVSSR